MRSCLEHISIHIHFRLRYCLCPILWGWQHQAMSNTSSKLSMHLCQVGQCQLGHTYWHQSAHIHTCLPGPDFLFSAGNLKVCYRFDTGHGLQILKIEINKWSKPSYDGSIIILCDIQYCYNHYPKPVLASGQYRCLRLSVCVSVPTPNLSLP